MRLEPVRCGALAGCEALAAGRAYIARLRMDDRAPPSSTDVSPGSWPAPHPALQGWLLAVAERQDQRAFEQVHALLAPRVRALVQRILRDRAATEEVVGRR